MSMQPRGPGGIPAATVRVARAAFPTGSLAIRVCDELGPLFTDEGFADLFPARGKPAWSPGRLALVLVLQFVEGLTDRQAAEAARAEQHTDPWKDRYKIRAGVEGTVSQGAQRCGLRRSRYRGLAKTSLQHQLTGAAINLTRIDAHLTETPLARTRTSHFAALRPADQVDGAKQQGPNQPTASARLAGPACALTP